MHSQSAKVELGIFLINLKNFNIMKKLFNTLHIKALSLIFALSFIAFSSNAQDKSVLKVGETLKLSERLVSPNGKYEFLPLMIYDIPFTREIWSFRFNISMSNLTGKPDHLKLDEKGSLVLYNTEGKVIWSSASDYPNVGELRLQNDGNLVIYDATGNDPIWALQDPKTDKYESGGNGFFIKYKGTEPDPSRHSNQTVNISELMKKN
jgi:hypothetical protein